MGIFDSWLRESCGGLIKEEYPNKGLRDLEKIRKENKKGTRNLQKKIEEKAEEINPVLGAIVKKTNNVQNTIEDTLDNAGEFVKNAEDSLKIENLLTRTLSKEVKPYKGDHLFVQRVGYTHHGLYIGDGKVIHYLLEGIREDDLETFSDGAKIHRKSDKDSPRSYSRDEVVSRAYRRMYEDNYNLIINNCEHFVRWCRNGIEY